jgi:4-diphosphocytidyl-2-C-methyl-D-erythritol kinase
MNSSKYTVKSPAKINIGLHILSNRSDGFHNIETIFYPVKIFDLLSLEISVSDSPHNNINIKTEPALSIPVEENICFKVAEKFFKWYSIPAVYDINIEINKIIPVSSGLGGGSSDAASVLDILAFHFKEKLESRYTLNRIAMKLGSDISYFLANITPSNTQKLSELFPSPAYASQRGERLKYINGFKINLGILIVNLGIEVSTSWAYSKVDIKSEKPATLGKIGKFSTDKLKKMYEKGAVFSSMSGSGSSVYGFFGDSNIENARSYFLEKGYTVFRS